MHTILFVDDEPNSTLALRMLLEAKGFRCVSLTNMTDGLEFLEKENVSALVSDIMMPSGDSFPKSIHPRRVFILFIKLGGNFLILE